MQCYPVIVIVNRVGYKERVKAVKRLQEGIESVHGLQMPREEIAFTARPKIQSQSQIFRYGRSIFCLPHQPNFSDIFDLCSCVTAFGFHCTTLAKSGSSPIFMAADMI